MSTTDSLVLESKQNMLAIPSILPIFTEPSTPNNPDIFKFSLQEAVNASNPAEAYTIPLNDIDLNAENPEDTEDYEHVAWGLDALINEAVIKSGFLMKKGEKRKKRWFVLKSTKLAYYKNEKEYELLHYIGTHRKHITDPLDLDSISTAALITSKKQCFGLVTKSRTYYIQADDEETMLDWVWEIQNALKMRKLGIEAELLSASHTSAQLKAKFGRPREEISRLSVSISKDSAEIKETESSVYATALTQPIDIELTPSTPYAIVKSPLSNQIPNLSDSPLSDTPPGFLASFRSPSSANIKLATAAFVKNNSSLFSGSYAAITVPTNSVIQPILVKRPSQNIPLSEISCPSSPQHPSLQVKPDPTRKSFSAPYVVTGMLPPGHLQHPSQTQIITPAQPTMASSLPFQSALRDLSTPIRELTPKNVKFEGVAASSDILAFQKCDFGDEFSSEEDMIDELMSSQGSGLVIRSRVLHQGYLEKQRSSMSKGWSVRWFVLRNNRLVCYKDDKEYETRRVIEMRDVLDVIEVDSVGKGKHFCFKVVLHKKSLFLCADNSEMAQEWIRMLKKVHSEVGQKVLLN